MKHVYEDHTGKDCQKTNCVICDGGLAVCTVCGLFEGSLTTDCPGEPSYRKYGDQIYKGELDYKEGQGWVNEKNPTNQSWEKSRIYKDFPPSSFQTHRVYRHYTGQFFYVEALAANAETSELMVLYHKLDDECEYVVYPYHSFLKSTKGLKGNTTGQDRVFEAFTVESAPPPVTESVEPNYVMCGFCRNDINYEGLGLYQCKHCHRYFRVDMDAPEEGTIIIRPESIEMLGEELKKPQYNAETSR